MIELPRHAPDGPRGLTRRGPTRPMARAARTGDTPREADRVKSSFIVRVSALARILGRGRSLLAILACAAGCRVRSAPRPQKANAPPPPNPVECENALPGDAAERLAGGRHRRHLDPGLRHLDERERRAKPRASRSRRRRAPTTSTSCGWATTAATARVMIASNIKPSAKLPQTQPECLKEAIDRADRLRQLGRVGLLDGARPTRSRASTSRTWCATTPAAPARSRSWCATTPATRKSCCRPPTRPGRPTTPTAATASTPARCPARKGGRKRTRAPTPSPTTAPSTARSPTTEGGSYLYYAEYQMIYWLEKNGYNVSYTSESQVDKNGALLKNHKVFVSSGHDEYWSAGQRANVEAAREAGVNLAFFSANEIFWKTRWGASIDGSNTAYRTLTSYKETHFEGPVDPNDPPTWTGAWTDPRGGPADDGGKPQNALTRPAVRGQLGHLRGHRAQQLRQAQDVAQHLRADAAVGADADARTRTARSATSGMRISTTATGPRASSTSPPRRSKACSRSTTTAPTSARKRTGTHHLTLYKAQKRRARVRGRHGAVVVGAGQRERVGSGRDRSGRNASEHEHGAVHRQPAGGNGRPADDAQSAASRTPTKSTDTARRPRQSAPRRRGRRCRTAAR